jgi:hypothetical protein
MARKTISITIKALPREIEVEEEYKDAEGNVAVRMARKILPPVPDRDEGKVFVLTEMPASRAEAWAMRAGLALFHANVELPSGFDPRRLSFASMAEIGLQVLSGLKWEDAEPLMDEMWSCVQIQPDPTQPLVVRNLLEEDIEEISTRLKLRAEVWKLHTDFLGAVFPSKSA